MTIGVQLESSQTSAVVWRAVCALVSGMTVNQSIIEEATAECIKIEMKIINGTLWLTGQTQKKKRERINRRKLVVKTLSSSVQSSVKKSTTTEKKFTLVNRRELSHRKRQTKEKVLKALRDSNWWIGKKCSGGNWLPSEAKTRSSKGFFFSQPNSIVCDVIWFRYLKFRMQQKMMWKLTNQIKCDDWWWRGGTESIRIEEGQRW